MQTYSVNHSLNGLWKYFSSEEILSCEVIKLKTKLQRCEMLRQSMVSWSIIKEIVSIGRSSYYRYKNW
jgi:hypothetical protein